MAGLGGRRDSRVPDHRLMPFTYSIANGLGAGFISYVLIRTFQGRAREVHPLMWAVAAAFLLFFGIGTVEELLGVK